VTVGYTTSNGTATSPADFTGVTGIATFANGVTTRTITIPTKTDTEVEGPQTFTVTLSGPGGGASLGGQATIVVTILDAQTPRIQFAKADYAVAETAGSVTLTVQRIGPASATVTVPYSLAGVTATGGSVDFDSTGGTLTIPAGQSSRTLVVPIVNDTVNEVPETFTVTLSDPTGGGAILGTPAVATVTITDNDPAGLVQFSQIGYAVVEGGTAVITLTRSGGTAGPVTVDFATSDGSATEPSDYTATTGTVTFQAGETTATFTIDTASDGTGEGAESVTLTLTDPTGGLTIGAVSTATLWLLEP
jgi:hypothetical protein